MQQTMVDGKPYGSLTDLPPDFPGAERRQIDVIEAMARTWDDAAGECDKGVYSITGNDPEVTQSILEAMSSQFRAEAARLRFQRDHGKLTEEEQIVSEWEKREKERKRAALA